MESRIKWIIIGTTVLGVVAYWYVKSKQPVSQSSLHGINLKAQRDFFKRLAVDREKKYQKALEAFNNLQVQHEQVWDELQHQQQKVFAGQSPLGLPMPVYNYYPPATTIAPLQKTNVSNVDQMINDAESSGEGGGGGKSSPAYTGVGPGLRKLNME